MSMTDRIGIAVSGCKNGYSILTTTENVDRNSADVKQALRDQRSFMRVNEPRHTYYTMSILPDSIVVSACRSSIDSVGSSGAYIAVSLLIPHFIVLNNGTGLLDLLLDAYWNEYMHPMFGSPVPGKIENINALRNILNANAKSFSTSTLRYKITPSRHNLPPVYISFNSEMDVDIVMANPYHTQYSQGAEVIFLPRTLFSGGPVSFNTETKTVPIQKAKPLSATDRLTLPQDAAFTICDYAVDGTAYPQMQDVSIVPQSRLSYTLKISDGQKFQFQGTLDEALRRNIIVRKANDYELVPPRITIQIRLKGHQPALGEILTLVSAKGEKAGARMIEDGLYEWQIMCGHFPYSLYRESGRTRTLLKQNAVTADSLSREPLEIDVTPQTTNINGSNNNKDIKRADTTKKKSIPAWLIASIAVACVLIIALSVYIFNGSEDNDMSENDTETSLTANSNTKPAHPDTTVIKINHEDVNLFLNGKRFDNVELKGFPAEARREPYNTQDGLIIKIPNNAKQKLGMHMEIIFLDKQKATLANVPVEPTTITNINDLMKFPLNTEGVYTISFGNDVNDTPQPEENNIMSEVEEQAINNTPTPKAPAKPQQQHQPQTNKQQKKQPGKKKGSANTESSSAKSGSGKSSESKAASNINF